MAITNPLKPASITPSQSKNEFKFTSDNTNISYFKASIKSGTTVVSNLKLYPKPSDRQSSTIDVSKIVSNIATTKIDTSNNLYVPFDLTSYNIDVTEYNLSGANVFSGSTLSTSVISNWNGAINKINFPAYNISQFDSSNINSRFLTNKPMISNIYFWTTEFLYFINNGNAKSFNIRMNYTDNSSNTINNVIDSTRKLGRLNISPRTLNSLGYFIPNLKSIEVWLVDASGNRCSELVIREFVDTCEQPVNFLFLNSLGGIDTVTAFNAKQTKNVSKTTLNTGSENVYKSFEHTLDVKETSTYSVSTSFLNDSNFAWATEIISSRAVFVQLSNGYLLPIKINNTSATIETSRFSSKPNAFEFQFTTESQLNIPYSDTTVSKLSFNGTNQVIALPAPNETYTLNSQGLLL